MAFQEFYRVCAWIFLNNATSNQSYESLGVVATFYYMIKFDVGKYCRVLWRFLLSKHISKR